MKSKASYFSISKPLILENLRRFWAIPALAFLVYFLSGVFPILMSYRHLNDLGNYIQMSLKNQQPFYMFAHLIFPIVAAVVIFKYLQGISSVSVVHAMPFTRAKLYNSGLISGLILIAAPILANGLILLAVSKPVHHEYDNGNGLITEAVDLFSRMAVLNWIWVSLIIALSMFAVAVFAGIVTGNSLMHFATGVWFNFLIPALYAVFIAYFSHYLYGFDTSGNWSDYGMHISPFLNILQTQGVFGIGSTIYYIAAIILILIISGFLYQKRKLEHATDSLAFGFMEPIISYLIAFLGMTLLGFYFQVLGNAALYLYAGFAAGTVIFFIIGQMIVKKTPRIYNLKSLKSLGIYTLIAAVFLSCLAFDLTGFEKRLPSVDKVRSFTLSTSFDSASNPTIGYDDIGEPDRIFSGKRGLRFKDPENIKAMIALHKAFIDHKLNFEDLSNVLSSNVSIGYNPDAPIPMTRQYHVDYDFYKNSPEFKQIIESKEYKAYYAPGNLSSKKIDGIYVSSNVPTQMTVEIAGRKDIAEFLACLDQDYKAMSFEDIVSLKHPYANVSINYTYSEEIAATPNNRRSGSVTYKITDNSTNSIQWLTDHGYGDRFTVNPSDISYIELYHMVQTTVNKDRVVSTNGYTTTTAETVAESAKSLKVTDPEQIKLLMEGYEMQNTNYNDYYYGDVIFKGSGTVVTDPEEFYKNYGVAYSEELAHKYAIEDGSVTTMQIYFNEGNIPAYVLDYFK